MLSSSHPGRDDFVGITMSGSCIISVATDGASSVYNDDNNSTDTRDITTRDTTTDRMTILKCVHSCITYALYIGRDLVGNYILKFTELLGCVPQEQTPKLSKHISKKIKITNLEYQ